MSGKSTTIRFMLSNALSLLGNSVAAVVLPLILLAKTGDPLAAGTLALVCAVPQVLAGVLGGVILDRFNRRNVSVISDIISAACVAALPLVELTVGLSFGWFVLFGVLGAVGDVPGMTARDTLLPAITKHDNVDLQRFMGISGSVESLVVIVGPALAALLLGFIGGTSALWVTAALSLAAALVTLTISKNVGVVGTATRRDTAETDSVEADNNGVQELGSAEVGRIEASQAGLIKTTLASLKEGLRVLFRSDGIITTSILISFGSVMVLGSYQGLVLPVYFTEINQPELLGYVLSVLSLGTLVGSLVYSALAKRLKKHTWYVLSLIGMAAGMVVLGVLPAYPILLLGAFILGLLSGPVSALLGFFILDRVPEDKRGTVFGTQNSLVLIAAPLAIFASSVLVSSLGIQIASGVLIVLWLLVTLLALASKNMRNLDS